MPSLRTSHPPSVQATLPPYKPSSLHTSYPPSVQPTLSPYNPLSLQQPTLPPTTHPPSNNPPSLHTTHPPSVQPTLPPHNPPSLHTNPPSFHTTQPSTQPTFLTRTTQKKPTLLDTHNITPNTTLHPLQRFCLPVLSHSPASSATASRLTNE